MFKRYRSRLRPLLAAGLLLLGSSGCLFGLARADAQAALSPEYTFGSADGTAQTALGYAPLGLTTGPNGMFYSVAQFGGANGNGTVFKVGANGTGFSVLHAFDSSDGVAGGLMVTAGGLLVGTEPNGGANSSGAVFKLAPDGSGFTSLYAFSAADANGVNADGVSPTGALLEGSGGAFYGETQFGGPSGEGGVYKINVDGSGFTALHSFGATASDGAYPAGGLVAGTDGYLYGVTAFGGAGSAGTVFKLKPDGSGYTVLYQFSDDDASFVNADGAVPAAALTFGTNGFLYGVTVVGGTGGNGTLFRIGTDGTGFTVLHAFSAADSLDTNSDGAFPNDALVKDSAGNFYGTTFSGGSGGQGTLFRLNADGSQFAALYALQSGDGTNPALAEGSDGLIYGTTADGGANGAGALFRVDMNIPVTHILWTNTNGSFAVWRVDANNNMTSTPAFGPIAGWTAAGLADGLDGKMRLLLKNASGAFAVWTVDMAGNMTSTPGYGPIAGWSAAQVAVGADGQTRLLLKNASGAAAVWTLDSAGNITSTPAYGPYSGWVAKTMSVDASNNTHLLFSSPNGQFSLWRIDGFENITSSPAFGPYSGWSAVGLAAGADGDTRLLLNNVNEMAAVWTVDNGSGVTSTPAYGPIANWSEGDVTVGTDGLTRLLLKNVSGEAAVWTLDNAGNLTSTPGYGPYSGWSAIAISARP